MDALKIDNEEFKLNPRSVNARTFLYMIRGGADELHTHAQEVNDLNVFPIPDGDTGDNMAMTIDGGAKAHCSLENGIGQTSQDMANAMLLSARGNSGVILSQFFAGIADGLKGLEEADVDNFKEACRQGVKRAYDAVLTPTEGTILTVAKEATVYACGKNCSDVEEFLFHFLDEANRSLERTPEKLAVLKEAGVVDSGAAGLIYIIEGMYRSLTGRKTPIWGDTQEMTSSGPTPVNVNMFTSDMELEFGYCTELLIRLQDSKVDVESFDISKITDYLGSIGADSVVCLKNDSIVKLHVHTRTPHLVLEHCQKFGEFLTLKIENMMLQHNEAASLRPETAAGAAGQTSPIDAINTALKDAEFEPVPQKKYGIVAVASGSGIREDFEGFDACVIEGGQTMNPSTQDFLEAFDKVYAENIFVLPNNGNIIMAATQAAGIYEGSDVRVIPTKTIGDCYSVLSMLSFDSDDVDSIEEEMNEAFAGVETIEISKSIRDTVSGGLEISEGDYLGIIGKNIVSASASVVDAACEAVSTIDMSEHYLCVIIRGKDADSSDSEAIASYIRQKFPMMEVCQSDGMQEIYDFYLVVE